MITGLRIRTSSRCIDRPSAVLDIALQAIQVGNTWMGIQILSMSRITYTSYEDFKNGNSEFASLPYLLLPIKALFDLNPVRNVVKLVYGMPYLDDDWGTAFFDSDTGLCLFNLRLGLRPPRHS
jgi:hypothetical protein